jgi:hypothetical protein
VGIDRIVPARAKTSLRHLGARVPLTLAAVPIRVEPEADVIDCPACGEPVAIVPGAGGEFACPHCAAWFEIERTEPEPNDSLDRRHIDRLAKLKRAEAREQARRRVLSLITLAAGLQLALLGARDRGAWQLGFFAAACACFYLTLRLFRRKADRG